MTIYTLEDRGRGVPSKHESIEGYWYHHCPQLGGVSSWRFKTQSKLSYLYANTETKPAQEHFTQLQALKKWTVVETFIDPT